MIKMKMILIKIIQIKNRREIMKAVYKKTMI